MIDVIRGCAAFVFAFSFAIFIHEFGHFTFAKLFGVYVETFSIGFGKKLWKRKWGETEYAISALPFGGYVKMRGMHSKELEAFIHAEDSAKSAGVTGPTATVRDAEPANETLSESVIEEMDALRDKPYWQKFLIFSAGCINNFLTGVAVIFILGVSGFKESPPPKAIFDTSEYVAPGSLPLKHGDRITALDGKPVDSMDDFLVEFDKFAGGKNNMKVPISVLRDGTTVTLDLPLQTDPGFPLKTDRIVKVGDTNTKNNKAAAKAATKLLDKLETVTVTFDRDGHTTQGVVPLIAVLGPYWVDVSISPMLPPYVGQVERNLPAEKAGIHQGDTIVSINGTPIKSADDAIAILRSLSNHKADIVVSRAGQLKKIAIEVRANPENPRKGQIGIGFSEPPTAAVKLPPLKALKTAFFLAGYTAVRYWQLLSDMVKSSFQTIRESVGGPIQIAGVFYSAANQDLGGFLRFFAGFNIILALTNLLPLPVLDGGHILFSTIEFIIRRPLPAKWLVGIYNVFIFLIIGLAVLITFNDVIMNFWRLL